MKDEGIVIVFKIQTSYPSQYRNMLSKFLKLFFQIRSILFSHKKTLQISLDIIQDMRHCGNIYIYIFFLNLRNCGNHQGNVKVNKIILLARVADVKILSDSNTPMRIRNNGVIEWSPMGLYVVSCESDITYYPVDSQTCYIKISSWGYTSGEIDLQSKSSTILLGFYSPNGEWDLLSTSSEASAAKTRGDFSFSSLTFTVRVQRRLLFHTLNTMFPVALMAFLIPMVFKLHPDAGEKIGFALTVLLAYAVYLTMISDSIPSTSFTPCYLCKHL